MIIEFLRKEEGAQVIEYALIIAMISIALVIALQPGAIGASIGVFISKLSACLAGVCA